ncbi:MAG TPA: MFS transporter, partial [Ktedonobacterales bacterium]|nr:MFS transporter [Ktedonobacterales bacterium]
MAQMSQQGGGEARQGMFAAMRFRNYRLFWSGQVVSVTGTFMQSTAQQWLVLTLSRNPLALGIVGALQFGPLLLLGPFAGLVVDRWPRRTLLLITQTSSAILASALWLLTVTHVVQLWHVYLLATLLGLVNALDMPTRQAFVSEMVPTSHLLNAVSLNSVQFNVARILGPAVAGALIALLGIPMLFLLNAISFLAVIGGLLLMRASELVPVPHTNADAHGLARLRGMSEGIRFIWSNPSVRVTFFLLTIVGTLGFNFNVSLPLEAHGVLHAGPTVFGLLSSALGIGALVGALTLARRGGSPSNRLLIGTTLAFGALEAA